MMFLIGVFLKRGLSQTMLSEFGQWSRCIRILSIEVRT